MSSYKRIYEKYYNEKLKKEDRIHHIDMNHNNNNPENLWKTCHNRHLTAHKSARLVRRILWRKLWNEGRITFDRKRGIYSLDGELIHVENLISYTKKLNLP